MTRPADPVILSDVRLARLSDPDLDRHHRALAEAEYRFRTYLEAQLDILATMRRLMERGPIESGLSEGSLALGLTLVLIDPTLTLSAIIVGVVAPVSARAFQSWRSRRRRRLVEPYARAAHDALMGLRRVEEGLAASFREYHRRDRPPPRVVSP